MIARHISHGANAPALSQPISHAALSASAPISAQDHFELPPAPAPEPQRMLPAVPAPDLSAMPRLDGVHRAPPVPPLLDGAHRPQAVPATQDTPVAPMPRRGR